MKLISQVFFIFLGSLLCFDLSATTWETNNQGYWNNGSSWIGGVVPPHSSADTFYINHPIVIGNTIDFQPGGYLLINTTGGICGHERLNLHTNALLHNHGILELDSLEVPGGHVQHFITGNMILTFTGHFSNGGTMSSNGAIAVGPWFECHQPEYSFLTGIQEQSNGSGIMVYPIPASSQLHIESTVHVDHAILKNLNGKVIANISAFRNDYELHVDGIAEGMYFIEFYDAMQRQIQVQKIIINH